MKYHLFLLVALLFMGYYSFAQKKDTAHVTKDSALKKEKVLDTVVVKRPPIVIKKDTIEYTASAFKVRPYAVVEDLLKKLPGVTVDKDGNVMAHGEIIKKIYVNGKEFFVNDPKIATKNLTADMIESIQVFNEMSEQAKFTQIDDGSRSKVINLKLKRSLDGGFMGKMGIGYGSENRYSFNGMINYFHGTRTLMLLGSTGNIPGFFGNGDIHSSGAGGVPGIARNTLFGLNYSDKINKKLQLSGNYNYMGTFNSVTESSLRRTTVPEDSTSSESRDADRYTRSANHNLNIKLDYRIDSMNFIIHTLTVAKQGSNSNNNDTSTVDVTEGGIEHRALTGSNKSISETDNLQINNVFLYRRRFRKIGRTFILNYSNSIGNTDGSGDTYSLLSFYNTLGAFDSTKIQKFRSTDKGRSLNNSISSAYTEPLGKKMLVEINYTYTNNNNSSDRIAHDFIESTNEYDSINPQQTNYFKNSYISNKIGTNFRLKQALYNIQVGASMQAAQLNNISIQGIYKTKEGDSIIKTKATYVNFFPTASFNWTFNNSEMLAFSYQGNTNQPDVKQLQDVRDETDPLKTLVGNPNLNQEFSHQFGINYNRFATKKYSFLSLNVNYGIVSNKIVNSINNDTLRGVGVQLIQPVNLSGNYNISGNMSYNASLGKENTQGKNINLSGSFNYRQEASLVFGEKNLTKNLSISSGIHYNMSLKEKWIAGVGGEFTYNKVAYSRQQNTSQALNTAYFSQSYSIDLSYNITKELLIASNFNCIINSGLGEGFNQAVPVWNSSISYRVFKRKNGFLNLALNDILNQNQSIRRTIGDNYILDTKSNVLKRYVMLSLAYNLNRFKSGPNGRPKK